MRFNPFTSKSDWVVDLFEASAPSSTSTTCTQGNMAFDDNYLYLCIDTNSWKRTALSSWAVTDLLLLDDGTSHVLLSDGVSKILIRP